jgi:hypothetical protein
MERHLAACPRCRAYYNELKALAEPLAGWEKWYAHIEPTADMHKRWAEAVQASAAETAAREHWASRVFRNVWLELIWPCRRSWAGLAAVWLGLLAVNARLPVHPTSMAGRSAPSAPIGLWEEQIAVLTEMAPPALDTPASAKAPAAPAHPPRPRSARKADWQMA